MEASKKEGLIKKSIIAIFVSLYVVVSLISTIHVIEFFELSNPRWLAISLAIAFEIGAAASLASIIILDKTSKSLVWILFIILTGVQINGNLYYAYSHLKDFKEWIELFGLMDEDIIYQKRIVSIISGAILPLVALGFIKSLVDYIRPSNAKKDSEIINDFIETENDDQNDQHIIEEAENADTNIKSVDKPNILSNITDNGKIEGLDAHRYKTNNVEIDPIKIN